MKKHQGRFLQRTRIALTNALNTPELLTALTQYTYSAEKIQEGLQRYRTVEELTEQRERAWETQYQTTQLLTQTKEDLLDLFRIHVDTARLAYRREAAQYQDTLKLTGPVPRATAACLAHIKRFYARVPAPLMAKYHVPRKALAEGTKLVERVQELLALQAKTTSQPQLLTEARQRALAELQAWMRRFHKAAQLALDDQPQQREILGQVVKG